MNPPTPQQIEDLTEKLIRTDPPLLAALLDKQAAGAEAERRAREDRRARYKRIIAHWSQACVQEG